MKSHRCRSSSVHTPPLFLHETTAVTECARSAAVQGQAAIVRMLVAAGADPDLKVCHVKGGATNDASPLLLAVVGGHPEAAEVLLGAG